VWPQLCNAENKYDPGEQSRSRYSDNREADAAEGRLDEGSDDDSEGYTADCPSGKDGGVFTLPACKLQGKAADPAAAVSPFE